MSLAMMTLNKSVLSIVCRLVATRFATVFHTYPSRFSDYGSTLSRVSISDASCEKKAWINKPSLFFLFVCLFFFLFFYAQMAAVPSLFGSSLKDEPVGERWLSYTVRGKKKNCARHSAGRCIAPGARTTRNSKNCAKYSLDAVLRRQLTSVSIWKQTGVHILN